MVQGPVHIVLQFMYPNCYPSTIVISPMGLLVFSGKPFESQHLFMLARFNVVKYNLYANFGVLAHAQRFAMSFSDCQMRRCLCVLSGSVHHVVAFVKTALLASACGLCMSVMSCIAPLLWCMHVGGVKTAHCYDTNNRFNQKYAGSGCIGRQHTRLWCDYRYYWTSCTKTRSYLNTTRQTVCVLPQI